jgi:uncharacterized iron-regulated membrane protein
LPDQARIPRSSLPAGAFSPDCREGALPPLTERTLGVTLRSKRRYWIRRLHAALGLLSAFNLVLLISTGFLLQHRELLRLDERTVSRRILPSSYRIEDPGREVRADIVITDLHSGRLFGTAGALLLDTVTLVWLIMLATGLAMYISRARANRRSRGPPEQENEE